MPRCKPSPRKPATELAWQHTFLRGEGSTKCHGAIKLVDDQRKGRRNGSPFDHFEKIPQKLTCPLKIDRWVRWNFLLKWSLFSGFVRSFSGGYFLKRILKKINGVDIFSHQIWHIPKASSLHVLHKEQHLGLGVGKSPTQTRQSQAFLIVQCHAPPQKKNHLNNSCDSISEYICQGLLTGVQRVFTGKVQFGDLSTAEFQYLTCHFSGQFPACSQLSVYQNVNKRRYVVWLALRVDLRIAYATAVSAYAGNMLRYLLTHSLRETAFPQNEHQTTAPAYARRFSARNWIIPSAYAWAYALALLQFAYASLRNSGFGLCEASYDTSLSTHVKWGLGRCSVGACHSAAYRLCVPE